MKGFYDGTKILSMKDINGNQPEIYMVSTNRSGGKTTYFGRMLVNRFLKSGKKFMLVYRYKYELDGVSDKFFKDIGSLFFKDCEMSDKLMNKGVYAELALNDVPCGYAVALNGAEQVKKLSHLFSDTDSMLFDEFQSETNTYCPDELRKFISLHTSVARGQGQQHRHVPVYMLSNPISIINPYYTAMGISQRLRSDTKFLKGEGFVVEQGFNEMASEAQKESAFNKAFSNNEYVISSADAIYLNDSIAFIEPPEGKFRYYMTIKYKNKLYGIKEFFDKGIYYVDTKFDATFPLKVAITTDDMDVNYISLASNKFLFNYLRDFFEHGCFRFRDLACKEALMVSLSY